MIQVFLIYLPSQLKFDVANSMLMILTMSIRIMNLFPTNSPPRKPNALVLDGVPQNEARYYNDIMLDFVMFLPLMAAIII